MLRIINQQDVQHFLSSLKIGLKEDKRLSAPVEVATVHDALDHNINVFVYRNQAGASATYTARTCCPHPCPGNEPEHIYAIGASKAAVLKEVEACIGLLNAMGCCMGQRDWRTCL